MEYGVFFRGLAMNRFRNWLGALALVCTMGAVACTSATSKENPGNVTSVLVRESALGDSLTYVLNWTAGARADQYEVLVTPLPASGWTGLPTNARTAALTTTFTAINTSGWTTVSFTARVCSVKATVVYLTKCSTITWSKDRAPAPPGTPTVDSTQAIGLYLKPDNATVVAGGTVQFCTFVLAANGKVYGTNNTDGTTTISIPACVAGYATWFPTTQQVTPLTTLATNRLGKDLRFFSMPTVEVLATR